MIHVYEYKASLYLAWKCSGLGRNWIANPIFEDQAPSNRIANPISESLRHWPGPA